MKFYSQFGFNDPDAKAYEAQKELRVITVASENLYMGIPSLPPHAFGQWSTQIAMVGILRIAPRSGCARHQKTVPYEISGTYSAGKRRWR